MSTIEAFLKMIIIQFVFISILIITITVIRFLDNDGFEQMKKYYSTFAYFNTNVSYVYNGENS